MGTNISFSGKMCNVALRSVSQSQMPFKYKQRQNSRNKSRIVVATINNALNDIDKGGSIRGTAMMFAIDRNT
nr:unnamed protein product [Callosobruchus analis]